MDQEILSDSWTGFTQFTLLKEKPPEGSMWSGWRLTKRQATSRSMSRNSKVKEKRNWASERPKLENARKLRGIYFIDPEDKEFAEIIKNARKKLEVQTAPAMPCKRTNSKHGATISKNDDHKSKFACIFLKQMNPRDCVWRELRQEFMKTILREKGTTHCIITFGTQIYSCASSDENTGSKSSSGQRMGET